jgi:hypothetical protein
MIIKVILILIVIFLFNLGSIVETYANPSNSVTTMNWNSDFSFETINNLDGIQVKRSESYNENKDPALRKGTENWEQPQSNFWVIPAMVVGLVLIIVFFTREK